MQFWKFDRTWMQSVHLEVNRTDGFDITQRSRVLVDDQAWLELLAESGRVADVPVETGLLQSVGSLLQGEVAQIRHPLLLSMRREDINEKQRNIARQQKSDDNQNTVQEERMIVLKLVESVKSP